MFEWDSCHVRIHVEYLGDLGRHLDHANVSEIDRLAFFCPKFPADMDQHRDSMIEDFS